MYVDSMLDESQSQYGRNDEEKKLFYFFWESNPGRQTRSQTLVCD
jgi:hypothetical protein